MKTDFKGMHDTAFSLLKKIKVQFQMVEPLKTNDEFSANSTQNIQEKWLDAMYGKFFIQD